MTNAEPITESLASNEVRLFGKVHRLEKLKGRAARLMIPRCLEFATRAISLLVQGEVDVLGIITALQSPTRTKDDFSNAMSLIHFLSLTMRDKWEEFDRELLPFLLQVDGALLETEGDPFEVYFALFRAIQFYARESLTAEQKTAFAQVVKVLSAKNA